MDQTDEDGREVVVELGLLHTKPRPDWAAIKFRGDDGRPGRTQTDPHADQDERRRSRYDHPAKDRSVLRAQHAGGVDQVLSTLITP